MPRPKPDKIVRHQIVFGEADRKILASAVDSYNLNTITSNLTKILNDVTGTITLLCLLSVSGLLGVIFAYKINPIHLATGNVPEILEDFGFQWDEARLKAKENKRNEAEERRAEYFAELVGDGTPEDLLSAAATFNPYTRPVVKLYEMLGLIDKD